MEPNPPLQPPVAAPPDPAGAASAGLPDPAAVAFDTPPERAEETVSGPPGAGVRPAVPHPAAARGARSGFDLAVVGAGPAGLALALHAARRLPEARITVYDARPLEADVSGDPRTLALSLGSVHLLEQLGAWPAGAAEPIREVHVSQQPPAWAALGHEPALTIHAADEGVEMLGAVLAYGQIVAPLQAAWRVAAGAQPDRLVSRYGAPVTALKPVAGGVEVDAGIVERHDLVVVAEGGVHTDRAPHQGLAAGLRRPLTHDYRQTAWVGQAVFAAGAGRPGVAYERFTRHGPVALLPLPGHEGDRHAALVWCVARDDDPVEALDEAQRLAVLNATFHPAVGRLARLSTLKRFPLGLSAERTLVDGRTVRIGNAAQTLHPVAGQGLNLGLRDAYELVRALGRPGSSIDAALRRVEWRRAPDRWSMIAATDFLARSFTWQLPGAGTLRAAGLAALHRIGPARSALARQMMYGSR